MFRRTVSAIMLILILTSMLPLAFNIQPVGANGTIYIRADGSVDPPTAPISTVDNITYTFTDNIYDEIEVERNHTVIDGNGYTLQGVGSPGEGSGFGIYLCGRTNVTIRNMEIRMFYDGIGLFYGSSNNSVVGCNITANVWFGVYLQDSLNNSVVRCNITENNHMGIYVGHSSSNIIAGNNITANDLNGVSIYSLYGGGSSYNLISGNYITNHSNGISLAECSNNTIIGNNITECQAGIWVCYSSNNNNIVGNNIANNNGEGIWITESSNNSIVGNNITNNEYGVLFHDVSSNNNEFYHNNFRGNSRQVYHYPWDDPEHPHNTWDDGYPSGGNYWSDYTGIDLYRGVYQNVTWGDGIGDTPYTIDPDNRDIYPLMYPYPPPTTYDLPVGTFVIPMDEKQNLLTLENVTVYGFIWSILDTGADICRVIEPPDVTLKTTAYPEGAIYSGGVILVMSTCGDIIEEKRLNFPNVTIDTLTEPLSISPDQLFFVEKSTKILVIQGSWGHTEETLDWMKISYTLVPRGAITNNATMIHNYDLVVDDCPGWFGSMPAHVVDNFRTFAIHGGEIIFTDIALLDLAQVFPSYVNVVRNLDWIGNVSIHNPPLTGFSAEYPSQYPSVFPNTTKIYTMGSGNIVDTILNTTEVRVLMDTSEYDGANRTLAFCFPYGSGLVEGFAYHPQEQIESITGDRYSYVVSSIFYGNKFIHAIPTHDVAIAYVLPSKSVVGQGYSLNISAMAANQGDYTETFNVTLYANTTVIETTEVALISGNSKTITFTWNTTGFAYGNYTLLGAADVVPGEIDVANNNCACDMPIHVGVPGDVSSSAPGVYDMKCDMKDIAYLVILFNTKPSSPNWNPNADVDNNGVVSMIDIAIAILNFNQHE